MSVNGVNTENQEQEKKKLTKKQKIIITVAVILLLLIILLVILLLPEKIRRSGTPTLTIATPPKQSISAGEEFSVDVELSDLTDEIIYPAASLSVVFDSSRLEFTGISEGNIMISGDERADGNSSQLPEWSVDVERSNKTGQINIMYLDMTGGKYAFSSEQMGENHILMRLDFRLRGSAEADSVYNLEITDAVFAANDENDSLASINDTLITENGKVVTVK